MGISLWSQKHSILLNYLYWDRRNYQAIYREPKPQQEKRLTRGKINPTPKDISYNEDGEDGIGRNTFDGEKIEEQIDEGN